MPTVSPMNGREALSPKDANCAGLVEAATVSILIITKGSLARRGGDPEALARGGSRPSTDRHALCYNVLDEHNTSKNRQQGLHRRLPSRLLPQVSAEVPGRAGQGTRRCSDPPEDHGPGRGGGGSGGDAGPRPPFCC